MPIIILIPPKVKLFVSGYELLDTASSEGLSWNRPERIASHND
jgi:hypothetical protein